MVCKSCKSILPDGSQFCSNCGSKIDGKNPKTTLIIILFLIIVSVGWGIINYYTEFASDNASEDTKSNSTTVIYKNAQNKQEVINKIVKLLDDDIKWLEDGRSRGKYIEDVLQNYGEDEELSALSNYESTLFFLDVDEPEQANEQMRKISPDYDGTYSNKIAELGLVLFGNIDNWLSQYNIAVGIKQRTEEREKSGDNTFEREVIYYIAERCDYYGSTGDVTVLKVFTEAAINFNITVEEVAAIWANPDNLSLIDDAITKYEQTEAYTPDAISLYYKGAVILVGVTDDALSEAVNCLVKKDEHGLDGLIFSGLIFDVPSATKAIVLDRKLTMCRVRILEGTHQGETVWVLVEATMD